MTVMTSEQPFVELQEIGIVTESAKLLVDDVGDFAGSWVMVSSTFLTERLIEAS